MRRAAIIVFVLCFLAGAWWLKDEVFALCMTALEVEQLGPAGIGVFLLVYLVGTLLAFPASWFQGAAGFLFGPIVGIPLAWALSVSTGLLTFELARGRFREPVKRRLGGGRMAALDRASGEQGGRFVLLMRLSPIAPYNVINYLLGLTAVSRRQYFAGTALGTLVPVAVWAGVGAQLTELGALLSGKVEAGGFQVAAMGITAVASVGVVLFVRHALAAMTPEAT